MEIIIRDGDMTLKIKLGKDAPAVRALESCLTLLSLLYSEESVTEAMERFSNGDTAGST